MNLNGDENIHSLQESILKKAKKGRTYFKKAGDVFGIFSRRKHIIYKHRFYGLEDYKKLIFMSRFYPENGKITFLISLLSK